MRFLYKLRSRFATLLRRSSKNDDLALEMKYHIDMEIAHLVSNGTAPAEARKIVLREFGNVEYLKEECRDTWGMRFYESLLRHLRLAGRQMIKRKGLTATAVLTLALGVGANIAIYSLAYAELFQPLEFPDASQLVSIREQSNEYPSMSPSYLNFKDIQERQNSFSSIGAGFNQGYLFKNSDRTEALKGYVATYDLLETLRITPVRGRLFTVDDGKLGGPPVALISERFWTSHFNRSESIVGETITLTEKQYTIIGVLPNIYPLETPSVWTPMGIIPKRGIFANRNNHFGMSVFARLKSGVELAQANGEHNDIMAQLSIEYPGPFKGHRTRVSFLADTVSQSSKDVLFSLLASSGLLLLIACANVANMQLVQLHGRRNEFGIRMALGARKSQILGQLTVESLLLSLLGGLSGIALAYLFMHGLSRAFWHLRRISDAQIDGHALLYALLIALGTGILFGLAPMHQVMKRSHQETLKEGGKASDSRKGRRWKSRLVIAEVSLTSVLLIGTVLMMKTTANLYQSNLGFETENSLTFYWQLRGSTLGNPSKRIQIVNKAREELNKVAGIKEVGTISGLPLQGTSSTPYKVEGSPISESDNFQIVQYSSISDSFFDAVGMTLIAGRKFNTFDTPETQRVAIVDQNFVKRRFPNESPLGKRISLKPIPDDDSWRTIIGVVNPIKHNGAKSDLVEQLYIPFAQLTSHKINFVVKTEGDPTLFANAVRMTMEKIAPDLPISRLATYQSLLENNVRNERLLMQLLGVFAGLGLLLATVGLYGVLSYTVGQRTQEMGIRTALGASPRSIFRLTFWSGAKLVGIGLAIGLATAAALAHFLSSILYDVAPVDLSIYGLVTLLVSTITLLACWFPASYAVRSSPTLALRSE